MRFGLFWTGEWGASSQAWSPPGHWDIHPATGRPPCPCPVPAGTKGKAGWPCHSGPFWQPRTSLCDCWPASAPTLRDCTPRDSSGLWWGGWLVCPWAGRGCPVGLLLPGWLPSFPPSCPGSGRPHVGEVSHKLSFTLRGIFFNLEFKQLQVK